MVAAVIIGMEYIILVAASRTFSEICNSPTLVVVETLIPLSLLNTYDMVLE